MADFLGALADQVKDTLSSEMSLGENKNKKINLGSFAKQVDMSAERRYVEEGYIRQDPYNVSPKQFDLLIQEPSATVLVKKRMFSSLAENFRPDYMDQQEKLYYRAMRILFQNKCNQIAALEKLSKIQKVSSATGNVNANLMPILFGLSDILSGGFAEGQNLFGLPSSNPLASSANSFSKVMDQVKKIYAFNGASETTKWITDPTNLLKSQYGEGTGVIEITNFTNLNTSSSIELNPSAMSLSIVDPYHVMLITEYDIERAIADATNMFNNSQFFQFGKENVDQIIENSKSELNQVRSLRKASPISFRVSPDTLIGKRVVAVIDRSGTEIIFNYDPTGGTGFPGLGGFSNNSVSIDKEYLRDGSIAGYDGLDNNKSASKYRNKNAESEVAIFSRLITSIFTKLQLIANSKNAVIQNNKDTNDIRKELTFNFKSKMVLQEQDPIHIYINSKSRYDNKILAGLNSIFSGVGVLQNVNNTITDFKNSVDSLFNPSHHLPTQIEKSIYVGDNFPNFLWNMLRDQFVSEKEGTHVYGGLITRVSDRWSGGDYQITVDALDNAEYLNKGKINFKPSVDTFNGSIYDPISPFETDFNYVEGLSKAPQIPKLLKENEAILDAQFLKRKSGTNVGSKPKSNNYIEDASIDPNSGRITRVFHAPSGLSYKWKKNIGVFTQYGNDLTINNADRIGSANVENEPFAGLDIMNTISLLIAGVPYNFETYYNAGRDNGSFTNDPQSKQNSSQTFLSALRKDLVKSNAIWGNFIPFKNFVVNEKAYEKMASGQIGIDRANSDLEKDIEKLREIEQSTLIFGAVNTFDNNSNTYSGQYKSLQEQARQLRSKIDDQISGIRKLEDDLLKNSQEQSLNDNTVNSDETRRFLRKKMNFLTRRMSYDVRANSDKNLFIVDDNYDKDYDILAYNKSLDNNIGLLTNSYTNALDRIRLTADLLNMEVFCDTQGHIRARFPQYNRMPSSVFFKMLHLKDSSGIQFYPKFLDDFMEDQITGLKTRIEILENQIRLDCAMLGYQNDDAAVKFIQQGDSSSGTGEVFKFISDPEGIITGIDDLLNQSNQETSLFGGGTNQSLANYDFIKNQANSGRANFTSSQVYNSIIKILEKKSSADGLNLNSADTESIKSNTYIKSLISKIENRSNIKINIDNYITSPKTGSVSVISTIKQIDIFKLTKDISEKIKTRQNLMKMFYGAVKNSVEYKSIDNGNGFSLLPSDNYNNSKIPEVYEHMIEDESFDDLGFGSGKRFVIKNTQIIDLSINTSAPPYTTVQVNGIISDFALSTDGFSTAEGNSLTTATAVDYGMWRNYGFITTSPINLPFLNDAETQCAPYASMLLSRARKNTTRGSITIAGNEFMQPGEVIYLEDRQLLFYVENVAHNFSYSGSGSFTTTLNLSYGHSPGEYIPTFLDIIGKVMYKNRDVADVSVQRQQSTQNEDNIGSLINHNSVPTIEDISTIRNMMYLLKYKLSNFNNATDFIPKIDIRVYRDDNYQNASLNTYANNIKNILTGQASIEGLSIDLELPADKIDNLIKISVINLDDDTMHQSPSQKAMDSAKSMANTSVSLVSSSNSYLSGDKIKQALFDYVVDFWLVIEKVSNV